MNWLKVRSDDGVRLDSLTKIEAKDNDLNISDGFNEDFASMAFPRQISVIGLGYVGLPLAISLARRFTVVGYDINVDRVAELRRGSDRTGEVDTGSLLSTKLLLTTDASHIAGTDVFIITVPTPVDEKCLPDLHAVRMACRTVGKVISSGAIVVLESTVYPGVTEDICGPEIEKISGLQSGKDFYLGYSPERINPGDREHTIDRITKVVSGQTSETAERLAAIYGAVNDGQVYIAANIKTAEAAKVIENAQRDINIAFINEVTQIFHHVGLSIYDVLDASRTKWNFLPFTPGLVGGHCIGVDPFYLADLAQRHGHDPEVILAGRRINDAMGGYIADQIATQVGQIGRPTKKLALVLGLTFKENVADIRNSKVVDLVRGLERHGFGVDLHDPLADPHEAQAEYGFTLLRSLPDVGAYNVVVGAVAHDTYRRLTPARLNALLEDHGVVADIKGMWRGIELPDRLQLWRF